jgi:hypothetical protein
MPTFPANPEDRYRPLVYGPADVRTDPTCRDPNQTLLIINVLGVTTNPRYLPVNGATFCKTFAEDVMEGMNATFPHWVNPDGSPADVGKGAEVNINMGVDWLDQHGVDYGWQELKATSAISLTTMVVNGVNAGFPVLAVWKNPKGGHGHVMIPRPSFTVVIPDLAHIQCAQAGLHNFEAGTLGAGFGPLVPEVRFFQAP